MQYLLRFDIADLKSVLNDVAPQDKRYDWIRDPSLLVSTAVDPANHDQLSYADTYYLVKAINTILGALADVDDFLSYFVMMTPQSTVFRRYMDIQLGRSTDTVGTKYIAIRDGSMLREIQAVRSRLRVLARADVIPKAELELIAKMLTNSNVDSDIDVLNVFYQRGMPSSASQECALEPTARLQVLRRVLRQLQVLDLVNSMTAGLDKHELGHLMMSPADKMPEELRALKSDLERDADNVTLTQVKPDSVYIDLFQQMNATHMELIRNCGKYADFRRWIKDMKYYDIEKPEEAAERFNKMINHVTSLLQVCMCVLCCICIC